MGAVKVTTVGNSVGIILSSEVLEKLRVNAGDELIVRETPDGVLLTRDEQAAIDHLDVAKEVMHKRKELLRKLSE